MQTATERQAATIRHTTDESESFGLTGGELLPSPCWRDTAKTRNPLQLF